jgi:hypothetical protein
MKKRLLFDFDGVIHSYTSGWQGINVAIDEPVEGIRETLDRLINMGYHIVIYSSRCNDLDGIRCIENYCSYYSIPYHEISNKKGIAYLTIDDRCICFNGKTKELIGQIKNFVVWNKNTK